MGIIDTVIIILFGVLVVIGLFKGFVRQIFSFGALVLAIIVPLSFTGVATNFLGEYIPDVPVGKNVIVFVCLFLITFIIVKIIGHKLGKSVQKGALGWVDRLLGITWGALQGLIIVCLFFMFAKLLFALPFIGNTMETFIEGDLKINETGFMPGRYLYENNLLLKILENIK